MPRFLRWRMLSAPRSTAFQPLPRRQDVFWTGHGLRLIVTDVGGETIFDLNLKGQIFPNPIPK